MANPLIFTPRGWVPRVIDFVLTLFGWGGFIWLFTTGLLKVLQTMPFSGPRPLVSGLSTLTLYIGIGLFNALLLIGWAKYNQLRFRTERRRRRPGLEPVEVARSFDISQQDVGLLSGSDRLRVYHDGDGRITQVEPLRGPA
ncbi:poly-beta-1,6-N-acetyl-D-glucosamine biosynthesis protein PgaD [Erwinia sp. SLM-02]|uniref:poly-beta-1,6-N-acetyl-D-glucosamine biosynthesis protein PgaD n=1 Tax=Erwinia sp. SLM-02 TaxID=3020057 RepID=UPI0030801535